MYQIKSFSTIIFFILSYVVSTAQERVSDYQNFSQAEVQSRNGRTNKMVWNGVNYIVSNSGPNLKLQSANALHEPPIIIKTEVNCSTSALNHVIIDDLLYVTSSYEIQEINLQTELSTRKFNVSEYGKIGHIFSDNQDGLICRMQGSVNLNKMFVHIDLTTGESTSTVIPPAHSTLFHYDNLIAFSYDSTEIRAYDLIESTSSLLMEGNSLRPIYNLQEQAELLITDGTGQIFEYNSSGGIIEKCYNQYLDLKQYESAFCDNRYIYKMGYSDQSSSIETYSIFDRNSCEYLISISGAEMECLSNLYIYQW